MEFIVSGKENIPEGQVLFTPNHVSNADPIAMLALQDKPIAFLAKKEVIKMPVIGKVVKTVGGRFIDRFDLRSEVKVFRQIDKDLQNHPDLSYVVFPEGTRTQPPLYEVGTFHAGTFNIAVKRSMPIVPVCMYFTDRVLNTNYHYKVYPIQVRYLKPIMPEEYENMTTAEIAQKVQKEIALNVEEMKTLDRDLVKKLNHYSDEKTNKVLMLPKYKKVKQIKG